ncbi:MAG: aldehyde dehydrogenase family protein [Mycobacterium sp.]
MTVGSETAVAKVEPFPTEGPGTFRPYVNGCWLDDTAVQNTVIDPATEDVVAIGYDGDASSMSAAVAAARAAFDTGPWGTMSGAGRKRHLQRLYDALDSRRAKIARLVTAETGALPAVASAFHVGVAMEHFAWGVEQADRDWLEVVNPLSGGAIVGSGVILREPCGVVGAISAYNFPFFLNLAKLGGALVTGNTMVLKPSPMTPLEAFLFAEVAEEADLPPGVLNIVSGDVEATQALTSDPRLDVISFTGSDRVGGLIAAQAAPNITRTLLELGGKSALIVRADADLDAAVAYTVAQLTVQAGQGCALCTRQLVHRSIYDEFVARLAAAMAMVKTGDPRQSGVMMGPLIRESQVRKVEQYVDMARDSGAEVVTGGRRTPGLDRGFFYDPTVVIGVDNGARIAQEEIFGPVGVVMAFDDDHQAVAMANDSPFGLGGHIYSADTATAFAMCRRIRSGYLAINGGAGGMHPELPFGGYKRSGIGREYGVDGLRAFQQTKSISFRVG